MIWFLLATYFLGGGLGGISVSALTPARVEAITENVQQVVPEGERADAADDLLRQLRKEVRQYGRRLARSGQQMNRAYRDHDADTQRLLGQLQDLNADWEQRQQRVLDLRFALKEQLTETEWTQVFGEP